MRATSSPSPGPQSVRPCGTDDPPVRTDSQSVLRCGTDVLPCGTEPAAAAASRAARLKAWLYRHRSDFATWVISGGFHLLLALVLWSIVIDHTRAVPIDTLVVAHDREVENPAELHAIEQPERIDDDAVAAVPEDAATRVLADLLAPVNLPFEDPEPAMRPEIEDPLGPAIPNVLDQFGGRASATTRQALVERYGGNAASERAVLLGLRWLARHQDSDGSWSFDHVRGGDCRRECTMPGGLTNCRMGATSLALLCFLGAGHTDQTGEFRRQVKAGLDYLMRNMEVSQFGGDLRGGFTTQGLYVQGLAAIVLCEAHAMTNEVLEDRRARRLYDQDPAALQERQQATLRLREAAQQAIGFIAWSQGGDGGWRYRPQQRGDTSVVGWQVMALQSARSARIRIPPGTLAGANRFLNRVQFERGARYGYTDPRREGSATTAVGLLCRMYLGWRRDHSGLARGVQYLSKRGPSRNDMYYNYYATQVLHHWGGEEWEKWNAVMRDWLIETQETEGHAEGSWRPTSQHGSSQGGRLYQTTLSVMTLEVYYRHLPLYRDRQFEGALPPVEAE